MKATATTTSAGKIEVRALSKFYGDKLVIDDLSFVVEPGTVTGFLGPNGSGKSTTMRLIVGLDHPSSGTASIGGVEYAQLHRPLLTVGTLLDSEAVHPGRSAYKYLLYLAQTQRIPTSRIYSYRGLENMVGCNITSKTGIDPRFQTPAVGDSVNLHPKSPPLTVTLVDEPNSFVLLGAESGSADRALWSFHLHPLPGGRTRLIERGRYSHAASLKSSLVLGRYFVEPVGFVMSRKMLRTIAANAAHRRNPRP
ncbi:ATP-binding cassette domain-containing protein [Rhodococcoides fascians A25f]|nr:ATP-binding cassette domain-containing protein [Rhodococcus fascians A25f]